MQDFGVENKTFLHTKSLCTRICTLSELFQRAKIRAQEAEKSLCIKNVPAVIITLKAEQASWPLDLNNTNYSNYIIERSRIYDYKLNCRNELAHSR